MKLSFQFIIMVSGLFCTMPVNAQDPLFTQFFANPMFVNPAMAGTSSTEDNAAGRAVLHYRNHWPGRPGTFQSLSGSWDQAFDAAHGGFGAQFVYNRYSSGFITDTELRAFYSLRSALDDAGKHLLYSGIQLASASRSLDYSRLKFGDQLAPFIGMDSTYFNSPLISAIGYINPAVGILLSNENYYFGLAVHNLLEPNVSFFKNPDVVLHRRYTLHGGYNIPLDNTGEANLQPSFLFAQQKDVSQLMATAQLQWGPTELGTGIVRTITPNFKSTAVMANIGFRIKNIRMVYSFDANITGTFSAIPFSHEISMCYRWNTRQENRAGSKLIY